MCDCLICERINLIKRGENPYFVRELPTGYVVMGDHQLFRGYALLLCKQHATELHELDGAYRDAFLHDMAVTAEAVYNAFHPDKLNYELLGAGRGLHMHWHIFPRRNGDTPRLGPVWQMRDTMNADEYRPSPDELRALTTALGAEIDQLMETLKS